MICTANRRQHASEKGRSCTPGKAPFIPPLSHNWRAVQQAYLTALASENDLFLPTLYITKKKELLTYFRHSQRHGCSCIDNNHNPRP
mmetsp:Transcript_27820/g.71575  ORF Transcript_27820/g.71575 Transcript_27820/m.71575 type:complete len:87 (-) Transcript_27820:361-621(-)